ncbi:MAG: S4 domain-containing protein, partial [Oscillospiraceae bacterium]
MVHGEEEANKALEAARNIFSANSTSENMPTTEIGDEEFTDGNVGILSLLVKANLAPSNAEARRLVNGGGIAVNDEKVLEPTFKIAKTEFKDGFIIIKKGKKIFHKITIK